MLKEAANSKPHNDLLHIVEKHAKNRQNYIDGEGLVLDNECQALTKQEVSSSEDETD